MQILAGRHLDEEELERFALGQIPEDLLASTEEHLLTCASCLARLEDTEQYILVTKSALTEVVRAPQRRASFMTRFSWLWTVPKPVWAAAAAALIIGISIPYFHSTTPGTISEVTLQAARGSETTVIANSRSGLVAINMDVQQLPDSGPFQMQLVDAHGAQIWSNTVAPASGRIHAAIPVKLKPGQYWVRLFNAGGQGLLREYGLRLE